MPVCCWIWMHRLCALMRAEARGESGTLMACTPSCASSCAPSISLAQSMPRGGTISTSVMNLPCSTSAPIRERCAQWSRWRLRAQTAVAPLPATRACASMARIAERIARIWFGVVPQQPPTICAPAAIALRAKLAMYSGEQR